MKINRTSDYNSLQYNTHFTGKVEKPLFEFISGNLKNSCDSYLRMANKFKNMFDPNYLDEFVSSVRNTEDNLVEFMKPTHPNTCFGYYTEKANAFEHSSDVQLVYFKITNPITKKEIKIEIYDLSPDCPRKETANIDECRIEVSLKGDDNYIEENPYHKSTCDKNLSIIERIVKVLKNNITHEEIDTNILFNAEDDVIEAIKNNASATQIEDLCHNVEEYAKQCGLETKIRDKVAQELEILNKKQLEIELKQQQCEENKNRMNTILSKYGFGTL